MGKTITTDTQTGNLLVAVVAVVTTIGIVPVASQESLTDFGQLLLTSGIYFFSRITKLVQMAGHRTGSLDNNKHFCAPYQLQVQ